ncbi:hypothetical protein BCR34DRAFT_600431 [Clohesyomyces aquaticus]|uniref:BTB domain-containing protein n=1 Tax=Clohesyomyces aquaticus TaxID=1231657 RepID=A0A1Y1ZR73_9PLEO|nr:hypothetical protein BCR34DRAFT_600431 [Clohesyomyces aquaticus]
MSEQDILVEKTKALSFGQCAINIVTQFDLASSADKEVVLLEDDPSIFWLWIQLLHAGTIRAKLERETALPDLPVEARYHSKRNICQEEFEALSALYVLSDKLLDLKAKNSAIRAIIHKVFEEAEHEEEPCIPEAKAITAMYDSTPEGCSGRRLVVRLFTEYHCKVPEIAREILPRDFLCGLADELMGWRAKCEDAPHELGDSAAWIKEFVDEEEAAAADKNTHKSLLH